MNAPYDPTLTGSLYLACLLVWSWSGAMLRAWAKGATPVTVAHAVDELLAEHAPTNSLAALAAATPRDGDGDPQGLASQGEERTAGAPRVTSHTAGRAARHPLGVAMVLALALAATYLGVVVAWTAPLMSGGHLIAGPALIVGGGALIVRVVRVQYRRTR